MFHSGKLISRINNIHERALRIVSGKVNFQQYLKQKKSLSLHERNLQIVATNIFRTKNGLKLVMIKEVFKFKVKRIIFEMQKLSTEAM